MSFCLWLERRPTRDISDHNDHHFPMNARMFAMILPNFRELLYVSPRALRVDLFKIGASRAGSALKLEFSGRGGSVVVVVVFFCILILFHAPYISVLMC